MLAIYVREMFEEATWPVIRNSVFILKSSLRLKFGGESKTSYRKEQQC